MQGAMGTYKSSTQLPLEGITGNHSMEMGSELKLGWVYFNEWGT